MRGAPDPLNEPMDAAEIEQRRIASRRVHVFLGVCALIGALGLAWFAVDQQQTAETVAGAALVGLFFGLFLPWVLAVAVYLLLHALDRVFPLISLAVLLIRVLPQWRARDAVAVRHEAQEARFVSWVARIAVAPFLWLTGHPV